MRNNGRRHHTVSEAEIIEALDVLWDSPEIRRLKGELLVKYPDAYANISWGLAQRAVRREMSQA